MRTRAASAVCPSLVDLELLAQGSGPTGRERVRAVVKFAGRPIGLLREAPQGKVRDLRERALKELSRELAVALTARRLVGADATSSERATVVVCTRDRPELLEGCLSALANQDHPSYEILVVDNASRDNETRRLAEAWKARYVREERLGLDWARNRGLTESRSPIVAFTDDDARPERGWLSALVRGFGSPDVHAVTGLVLPAELETPAQVLFEDVYGGMGKGFVLRLHVQSYRRPVYRPEWVGVGCNMAFRRSAVLAAGGFDPALDVGTPTGGGGDLDVFQRLLESMAVIVYRPDAVVRHFHRRDLRQLERQLFDNGRAYGAMLMAAHLRASHRNRRRLRREYVRWLVRWHARRLALSVVGRERLPARLIAAELLGASIGPMLYLRSRQKTRRLARGTPAVDDATEGVK
jgi:glycosyltransferase involved in cell wall biosynthesis